MSTPHKKPDFGDKSNESKNRGWPKGKRRYPKGAGAPKQPLSGYVHFLNERRETVRAENPDITFSELSKKLAAEWSALADKEKNKYNELARKDKDRYDKEFAEYQHTDSYRVYLEAQREAAAAVSDSPQSTEAKVPSKKKKKPVASQPISASLSSTSVTSAFPLKRQSLDEAEPSLCVQEAPVVLKSLSSSLDTVHMFTEEFLEQARAEELELAALRKATSELAEQNCVLGKHMDSIKSAITKLEVETVQQRQTNAGVQQQLESIRQAVVTAFRLSGGNSNPLPWSSLGLDLENMNSVDMFVQRLQAVLNEQGPVNRELRDRVKDALNKIEWEKIQV